MNDFKIFPSLLEAAFGIRPAFSLPGPPSLRNIEQWVGIGKFEAFARNEHPEEIGRTDKSWMGTSILFPITLLGMSNARTILPSGNIQLQSYGDFKMPAATMVDFTRAKNIIETEVSTGWGTVKELYSFGDWQIKIRGLCLDEPDGKGGYIRTAQQQKESLASWEEVCQSIPVEGSLFADLNIDYITIYDLTFRQLEGKPWVIPFEMTCKSDAAPELTINSGNLTRK